MTTSATLQAPAGWPIEQPGLYMGYSGNVLVVLMSKELSNESFVFHVHQLRESIDLRRESDRVCVFYHSESRAAYSLQNLRVLGEVLKSRDDKLRKTTAAYCMCTGSGIVRTAIRILYSLAPPPYPQSVVKSVAHGYEFLTRNSSEVTKSELIEWHKKKAEAMGVLQAEK